MPRVFLYDSPLPQILSSASPGAAVGYDPESFIAFFMSEAHVLVASLSLKLYRFWYRNL
jgi:hypothetical protein